MVKTVVKILRNAHGDLVRLGALAFAPAVGLLRAVVSASGEYGAQDPCQEQNCQKFLFHSRFLLFITARKGSVSGGPSARDRMFGCI
jgi:hypothetical protein